MKAQAELCLEDLIRHAPGNVTLEQMTAILRQGHEVPFERAILKIPADGGGWDAIPVVRMLEGDRFAALILQQNADRFTSQALRAIDRSCEESGTCGVARTSIPRGVFA